MIPEWLNQTKQETKINVDFSVDSLTEIENLISNSKLSLLSTQEQVTSLIKGVLELNPNSLHVIKEHESEGLYAIYLDNMNVIYSMDSGLEKIVIKEIKHLDEHERVGMGQRKKEEWVNE